jgi:hypothetical protein
MKKFNFFVKNKTKRLFRWYNKIGNLAFSYTKMRNKVRFLLPIILLIIPVFIFGQRANNKSRSELGFLLGGTYYIGDLNQFGHFKNLEPAGALLYRFNIHSRLALRFNAMYGSVYADDKDSRYSQNRNRNLNFKSDIWELGGGLEFNYWPFQIGHPRYKGTAYLLVQIAAFHFNPKTTYNGNEVILQKIGTEGQGTNLSSKNKYLRTQVSFPIGLGCRFSLGKWMSIGLEYGIRKTFTDYIDDVGSSSYLSSTDLAAASGQIAADLGNKTLNQSRFGARGDASTKDWYAFVGMSLTFRLGNPSKCFFNSAYY